MKKISLQRVETRRATSLRRNALSMAAAVMMLFATGAGAQVTIGSGKVPEKFSVLELISNDTLGLRLPQVNTDQRQEIEDNFGTKKTGEAMGLQIFNTTTRCVETWNGSTWIQACPPEGPYVPPTPPVTTIPDGGGKSVDTWSNTQWVGAFWRNEQTGERIIRATNSLAWSVSVDEDYRSWIVVDNVRGNNTTLWTNTPDDAELYQLTNGGATLNGGTGDIFFRIGLKSTNPNPVSSEWKNPDGSNSCAPRYGTVTLTVGTNTYKLFIRQGEAADYVFQRTLAAKFSPYNLTNDDLRDNSPELGVPTAVNGGVFVEYPTQAGAFWQWGTDLTDGGNPDLLRHAYHPTKPTAYISGWDYEYSYPATNDTWGEFTDANRLETCPKGWHRPKVHLDDHTDTSIFGNNIAPASGSELMQSLFEVMFDDGGSGGSNTNSFSHRYFGYYADGFFDRRPIETQGGTYPRSKGVVSKDNKNAAYIGLLFTNTNASLFVPASGYRDYTNGSLHYTGYFGYAWSSSAVNSSGGWSLQVSDRDVYQDYGHRTYGYSIRCVADN